MSNFAPAVRVLPYVLLAGRPFSLAWAVSVEDGSALGAAGDLSGVGDVQVVAVRRLLRGEAPEDPVFWTIGNGAVAIGAVLVGEVSYPQVQLTGAAPDLGVYDFAVLLITGTAQDLLLRGVLEVLEVSIADGSAVLDFNQPGNPLLGVVA